MGVIGICHGLADLLAGQARSALVSPMPHTSCRSWGRGGQVGPKMPHIRIWGRASLMTLAFCEVEISADCWQSFGCCRMSLGAKLGMFHFGPLEVVFVPTRRVLSRGGHWSIRSCKTWTGAVGEQGTRLGGQGAASMSCLRHNSRDTTPMPRVLPFFCFDSRAGGFAPVRLLTTCLQNQISNKFDRTIVA